MKIIKPIVDLYRNIGVGGGTIPSLISTTVDNDYADWDILLPYVEGDIVVYGFLRYQAIAASTGQTPDTPASTYWVALGYSNTYTMFNGATTTATVQDGSDFVVEISGSDVNALAFFRLIADSVNIVMTHPTLGVVYDKTYDVGLALVTEGVFDYYEYFFLPFPEGGETAILSILDIPPYGTATIKITISRADGDASLGLMTYGSIREIATVDYGTSTGINNYSTKETNSYGDTTIVERPYTDSIEYDITLPRNKVSSFKSLLASYRATPILVIGVDGDEGTHIYGFIDDFDITYSDVSTADATLTIEGL